MRQSILTRKPTVGGGAGFSGACGPASAWRVLRPLPGPLRFSAKATRGPAPDAHLFEPLHLTPCSPEVTVTSLHSSLSYTCSCLAAAEPLPSPSSSPLLFRFLFSFFSLLPPGDSLPPPGGLARLRAFSLPCLVCWGGGVSCVA